MMDLPNLQEVLDHLNDSILTEMARRDQRIDQLRQGRRDPLIYLRIEREHAEFTLRTFDMRMERETIIAKMDECRSLTAIVARRP